MERRNTASPLSCEEGLGRYHRVQFSTVLQSHPQVPTLWGEGPWDGTIQCCESHVMQGVLAPTDLAGHQQRPSPHPPHSAAAPSESAADSR